MRRLMPSHRFGGASCRIRTNDPEITNHVLWPTELKRQADELTTSHRSTRYPCFGQDLGEFTGSWSCRTHPNAKLQFFFYPTKSFNVFYVLNAGEAGCARDFSFPPVSDGWGCHRRKSV